LVVFEGVVHNIKIGVRPSILNVVCTIKKKSFLSMNIFFWLIELRKKKGYYYTFFEGIEGQLTKKKFKVVLVVNW
jgi:hypothetical protein